jgi:predicted transposase/invertase (TIGR01784 family)
VGKTQKDILAGFLKTILDIPETDYEEIYIEDSLLKIESIGDKYGILDIKIKTKSGSIIDVEMQVAHDKFMKERVIYYISRMIAEQMGESVKYSKIQKVVSIIIAAEHNLIKGSKNFHHRFFLKDEESGIIFTNKLEIDTLEIKKLPKDNEKQTALKMAQIHESRDRGGIRYALTSNSKHRIQKSNKGSKRFKRRRKNKKTSTKTN